MAIAKHDWGKLQLAFDVEHERTGITPKAWCEKVGINYNSARRHLKIRGQSPAQPPKSRVAARSANPEARKTGRSAQSTQAKGNEGRDGAGRFVRGEYRGNPNPPHNIKPGMQLAKTHGGYAKYLVDKDAPEAFDDAREMRLRDELVFVRTRALLSTRHLSTLRDDLGACDDIEQRIRIYESITATEEALDRSMARIESIERTLSGIRIDDVREPHISAAARKLNAETNKIEKDGDSDSTPIGEVAQELQEIGTGGLMS
jgi:hypothetical protein